MSERQYRWGVENADDYPTAETAYEAIEQHLDGCDFSDPPEAVRVVEYVTTKTGMTRTGRAVTRVTKTWCRINRPDWWLEMQQPDEPTPRLGGVR